MSFSKTAFQDAKVLYLFKHSCTVNCAHTPASGNMLVELVCEWLPRDVARIACAYVVRWRAYPSHSSGCAAKLNMSWIGGATYGSTDSRGSHVGMRHVAGQQHARGRTARQCYEHFVNQEPKTADELNLNALNSSNSFREDGWDFRGDYPNISDLWTPLSSAELHLLTDFGEFEDDCQFDYLSDDPYYGSLDHEAARIAADVGGRVRAHLAGTYAGTCLYDGEQTIALVDDLAATRWELALVTALGKSAGVTFVWI
jgi:hypothetical protein